MNKRERLSLLLQILAARDKHDELIDDEYVDDAVDILTHGLEHEYWRLWDFLYEPMPDLVVEELDAILEMYRAIRDYEKRAGVELAGGIPYWSFSRIDEDQHYLVESFYKRRGQWKDFLRLETSTITDRRSLQMYRSMLKIWDNQSCLDENVYEKLAQVCAGGGGSGSQRD